MPTSSQAMILRNIETDFNAPWALSKHGLTNNLVPADVKSVDINEIFNTTCAEQELRYIEAYIHGNENEIRKKLSKILKIHGYRTVLSYNPNDDTFKWKFYKDTPTKTAPRPDTGCVLVRTQEVPTVRAKSASSRFNKHTVSFSEEPKFDSEFILPEKFRSLGFRDPHQQRDKTKPPIPNRGKTKGHEDKTTEQIVRSSPIADYEKGREIKGGKDESDNSDLIGESLANDKYEDRCYPASHTCKILPEKRPLTVCFSLPENEKYTHAEIKDILFDAFHCKTTKLQFDPLSVRAGDPIVRNRWLAEVSCRAEVDNMVRSGFKLGDVQIVIKPIDEIANREYNKFTYLEKIRKENTRFALPLKKAKSLPAKLKSAKSKH